MVVIEVQRYGDFGILQTDSIWVHMEINKFDMKKLPDMDNERSPTLLIEELQHLGFSRLKTRKVPVGGNL